MPRASADDDALAALYRRPGFLIRRAQQIAVSLFLEETGELGVTNTQYGILFAIGRKPGIDQISVAKLLGLDRSTTGMVLGKLEDADLVARSRGTNDKRKHSLVLTKTGEAMLRKLAGPAARAQSRLLSTFSPAERENFLALLEKFTGAFNGSTRVPIAAQPHLKEKRP